MTYSFDSIAKRVQQERAKVVFVIVRSQPRWAVILTTVREAGAVEGDNHGARASLKAPMTPWVNAGIGRFIDGKIRVAIGVGGTSQSIAEGIGSVIDLAYAEGCHHGVVKGPSHMQRRH
jgi:hypothetical protein